MKVRVHFEHHDHTEDAIIIEADSIDELRQKANSEVQRRNGEILYTEDLE